MEPVVGSILQVMPSQPGWSALFASPDDEKTPWEEAIVGWAVVVIWTTDETPKDEEPKSEHRQYQTEVQPMTCSQEGIVEVPCMRDVVQLAVLQPGQIRIARAE